MKALSFGEILFDIIEGEAHLGGAPLNFAAHLARCGVDSYILSRLGKDELGKQALSEIAALGVQTRLIQKDLQHPTGRVEVLLEKGQPDYFIQENVAWDFIESTDAEKLMESLEFDVFYFGTLAQRHPKSRQALRNLLHHTHIKEVFYDINLRKGFYSKEILENSIAHCTILKLNNEEVGLLSDLLLKRSFKPEDFTLAVANEYGLGTIVITAGAAGCYVYDAGDFMFVKGYPAQVKDTVGAGDAFSAAFVYRYQQTKDARQAADVANRLGAFVASSRGPIPEYSDEIRQMLAAEGDY